MKCNVFVKLLICTAAILSFAGCGGGDDPAPAPTAAVVTLSTTGTLATGSLIGGVDVTVTLPPGVSVKSQLSTNGKFVTDAGVVTKTGVAVNAQFLVANHIPGTGGSPDKVSIQVAAGDGFATGDIIVLNCVLNGSVPLPTDFILIPNTGATGVVDAASGADLAGITIKYSAVIQ